jgi:WD40 repeat protein
MLSDDGTFLVAFQDDKRVHLYETDRGRLVHKFKAPTHVTVAVFSPDNSRLLFGLRTLHELNIPTRKVTKDRYRSFSSCVGNGCRFSPDGSQIAMASHKGQPSDKKIRIFDRQTRKVTKQLIGHGDWLYAVAFTPDGRHFATGGGAGDDDWLGNAQHRDKAIRIWNLDSGKVIHKFDGADGHKKAVWDLEVSPDGEYLLSSSADATLKLWKLPTPAKPTAGKQFAGRFSVRWKESTGSSGVSEYRFASNGDVFKESSLRGKWTGTQNQLQIVFTDKKRGVVDLTFQSNDRFSATHRWTDGRVSSWAGTRID